MRDGENRVTGGVQLQSPCYKCGYYNCRCKVPVTYRGKKTYVLPDYAYAYEPWPKLKNPVHRKVYLIGSLRNPEIPKLANVLRVALGKNWTVFDDWHAAGPEADDYWREYSINRGDDYDTALKGYAARNVQAFDRKHLSECTHAVLVLPAGKSGHLELGFCIGAGKRTIIRLDTDYDRWDVMYGLADAVVFADKNLLEELERC